MDKNNRNLVKIKDLEEQVQFHTNVLANVRDSVIVTNLQGSIIYWNAGAALIFGYTAKEMIGKTPEILYPDIKRKQLISDLQRILQGNDYTGEWKGKKKDGSIIWVDIKTTLMRNAKGEPSGFIGIARDITDRKNAEEKIRESEVKYRQLFDSNIIGVFLSEIKGKILDANEAFLKITKYSRNDLKAGLVHRDQLTSPQQQYLSEQAVKDLKEKGASTAYEKIYIRKDGTQVPVLIAVSRLDQKDTAIGFVLDITRQKQAQEELLQSEARKSAILATALDAIISMDHTGSITEFNPAAEKMFGYTKKEVLGKKLHEVIIPHHLRTKHIAGFTRYLQSGEGHILGKRVEMQAMRKNGAIFPVELAVTRVPSTGEPLFTGYLRDITLRKQAEEALRKSQEQYKLVFEHATDLITVVDPACNYIFASPSHLPVLGYTDQELIGINAFDLIHPDDREHAKKEFARALTGEIGNATYRFKHKSGHWLVIESTGSSIFNDKNEPTMVVITSHDITQRTELEQRKDEFISIASHELKTPLTSIKVFTQLLLRHNQNIGDTKTISYLGKMEIQIDKLTKLIGDLLDISKIQAGKLNFHTDTFSLKELVLETIEIMQTTTQKHTVMLKQSVSGNVIGDRDRISQVLINLISNAIKYSPKANKLVVYMERKDHEIIVGIQDFGIGIPREYQHKIFDRFFRVSGENEKTFPGFGIGLYISSEIISRHRGKLWVESSKGQGSTFYFSLPLQ